MFKYRLFPALSAFGILFLAIELGGHYIFNLFDGAGFVCKENQPLAEERFLRKDETQKTYGFDIVGNTNRRKKEVAFDTSVDAACTSTGVFVKKGLVYSVNVQRPPGVANAWTFFGELSYMGGQPISRLPWYKEMTMAMLFPLRRTLDRPWGAFILRIGEKGNEESFLDRQPPLESDNFRTDLKSAEISEYEELGEPLRPERDGELFVYLNKPVFRWVDRLIGNTGVAKITITYAER